MNELKSELLGLQNLEAAGELDEAQKARVVELPSLIAEAEKTADELKSKELQSALAQKDHYREKFEKAESDRKALEARLNNKPDAETKVEALDLIKLGKKLQDYSDLEIDFATAHAKSKNPEEILRVLDDPMVKLAIQAHREKEAKDRQALKPSGTQADGQAPRSMDDLLDSLSMEEKEKKLIELGLYIPPKRRVDRVNIGTQR